MSLPPRVFALAFLGLAASALSLLGNGCGTDSTSTTNGSSDGGDEATTDGAAAEDSASETSTELPDAAGLDASCPKGKVLPATGETCIGFGKGTPCDPACGLGEYGYVCLNGGPPGFTGCVQASSTGGFGDTYCCPKNECVPQPDQDSKCTSSAKPHRYQCPPDGAGNPVAPPAGCTAAGTGGSKVEAFFCCP